MTSINMRETRYLSKNYQVEILLNNLVDKDIQAMLMPLNVMQSITFSPKYHVKGNFITPNNRRSNLVSLLGTFLFLAVLMQRFSTVFEPHVPFFFFLVHCVDSCVYFFGFCINFFVGVKYSEHNVRLLLSIQDVHRHLNDEPKFRRMTIWNWVIFICVSSLFLVYFIYFHIKLQNTSFNIGSCILIVFDFNMIYAIRLITFLESKVVLWNIQALKSQELKSRDAEMQNRKMFKVFVKIFECYEMYKVTFKYLILYIIVEGFIHALLYMGALVFLLGNQGPLKYFIFNEALSAVSLFMWLMKSLLLQIILTQSCEKFYKAVENVQDTCAILLINGCSDDKKMLCKNIQRLYRTSFTKISMSGLLYVDAALTLELISTVTSYVIVMLQFMFL